MANSLGRDIEPGENIVLKAPAGDPDAPIASRLFQCLGGYGMLTATAGSKIRGTIVATEESSWITGYDIDPDETARFQQIGKPGEDAELATDRGTRDVVDTRRGG